MDLKPDSFSVDFLSHGVRNPTIVGGKPKEGNGSLLLTKLGWHSIGYVKDNTNLDTPTQSLLHPDKGEIWSTFQFHLSIGEKIFGLGERYGPFVKNGQVRDADEISLVYDFIGLTSMAEHRDVERRRRHFV